MAVIYSKLGGYLGVTAKLGPLARTDLCAGVKGLLERLITHLGLGSSGEDPCRNLLGGWVVGLLPQVPGLSAWEAVLFPWEAQRDLCLPDLLPLLPDWPNWKELPAWEAGEAAGLSPSLGEGGVTSLPATLETWGELLASPKGRWTPAWEITAWLPAWDTLLSSPRGRRVPAWLPVCGKLLPSLRGRRTPAWLPAWDKFQR